MQKSSVKLYSFTLLFTLSLASFTLAGDSHFPVDPPPPDDDGRVATPVVTGTEIFVSNSYQFLNEIRDLFAEIANK